MLNVASSPSATGSGSRRERAPRFVLDDSAGAELDRLDVAVHAARPESDARELGGDVVSRLSMAFAPGVPTFEPIVGQELDVRPPAVGVSGRENDDGPHRHE